LIWIQCLRLQLIWLLIELQLITGGKEDLVWQLFFKKFINSASKSFCPKAGYAKA
jgi:hypothetical protein